MLKSNNSKETILFRIEFSKEEINGFLEKNMQLEYSKASRWYKDDFTAFKKSPLYEELSTNLIENLESELNSALIDLNRNSHKELFYFDKSFLDDGGFVLSELLSEMANNFSIRKYTRRGSAVLGVFIVWTSKKILTSNLERLASCIAGFIVKKMTYNSLEGVMSKEGIEDELSRLIGDYKLFKLISGIIDAYLSHNLIGFGISEIGKKIGGVITYPAKVACDKICNKFEQNF